jgi:hypothetical protein
MKRSATFVAECFWPDVTDSDLEKLDRRVIAATSRLGHDSQPVSYLGSILVREDEVVLCHFEGAADAIRRVAEEAEVPYERLLAATASSTEERTK